jgi:antitoxin VapB
MAFSIKSEETDRLARQLSAATGESLTEAVTLALRERLERLSARHKVRPLADELDRIAKRCSALPLLDSRPADQILGYDKHGLPR